MWQKRLGSLTRWWNIQINVNPTLIHKQMGQPINFRFHNNRFIYGKWTEFLCAVDIASLEDHLGGARVDRVDPSASNMPKGGTMHI